jgi:hypothetical protein
MIIDEILAGSQQGIAEDLAVPKNQVPVIFKFRTEGST